MKIHRRALCVGLGTVALALSAVPAALAQGRRQTIEVWKGPACGCCKDWLTHLQANGFTTRAYDVGNDDARKRLGMPQRLASCHTGLVGGYVIEGHVPAREIHRLLTEKPEAIGLAVPGMPIGSPGMDGPEYGGRRDRYAVLLVRRDGSTSVYQSYG